MAEPRFLLVRLGSLGDIIHALPSAASLRETFPGAHIDWVVEAKWARLLRDNPDITNVIVLNRGNHGGIWAAIRQLRWANYTCAIDFQALYKSALLAFASGSPRRIGFKSSYAREGPAAALYNERLNPRGPHKVDHNFTLVEAAGARALVPRFPITVEPEDQEQVARELSAHDIREFFVLNPGGGWLSKCWPAERYGELHRKIAERFGWRGVITFGPGEENLARQAVLAAGNPAPVALPLALGPLMALFQRAKFVVSADTGPLHLAAAFGAPIVGLYGPTDPSRNGPYGGRDVVVRNVHASVTTYQRGASYSPAMLSITVDQVLKAIECRVRLRS
jgi:heptosyltransferase I